MLTCMCLSASQEKGGGSPTEADGPLGWLVQTTASSFSGSVCMCSTRTESTLSCGGAVEWKKSTMNFWSKVQSYLYVVSQSAKPLADEFLRHILAKHKQKPLQQKRAGCSTRDSRVLHEYGTPIGRPGRKWPPAKKVAPRQQTELPRLETP